MEWREHAACVDVDPELFFPLTASGPSERETAQAVAVCSSCQVRLECLDWSLTQEIVHGVWGGLSEADRTTMLRERRSLATTESAMSG
jgi:WhiB family transcriptional regulator, redox-sensing transcriptional regulator